jgi:alginate O-acetyltransferase complex protein AlgI
VGISFYTFQTLAYSLDVYLRRAKPAEHFLDYALFVTFFPQLVAGPIVRPTELVPQFEVPRQASSHQLGWGGALMAFGLFQKIVFADVLFAPAADAVFGAAAAVAPVDAWIGVLAFAGQIFCDFAGYSTIAIGAALALGFSLPDNFRMPYAAVGFSDFWRRWHISLSTWLRDYLYIPLGGNRQPGYRTMRNLMLTMLLGGLWHGASWTFVVWGALHGTYLIVERALGPTWRRLTSRFPSRLRSTLQLTLVFSLTCLAWVFFRAENSGDAWEIVRRISSMDGFNLSAVQSKFVVAKGLGLIALLLIVDAMIERGRLNTLPRAVRALGFAACLWTIAFLGVFSGSQFIYFQF